MRTSSEVRSAADIVDQLRKEHFSFSKNNPNEFPDFSASDRSVEYLKKRWANADPAGRVVILQSLLENEKAKERRIRDLIEESKRCLSEEERKRFLEEQKNHSIRPEKKKRKYERLG